ncbi:hypothetical protein AXX17_AT2G10260 [Arabidopsis thaliana]|uniref:Uncharacterized protein n=1 Tax=Arabidopsis thaliana TaxID=3702 RepID=A0A178VSD6_ARATH|nr:hypothetical protein AXX17_AT2G10260 [Arabidopsis thaliana]
MATDKRLSDVENDSIVEVLAGTRASWVCSSTRREVKVLLGGFGVAIARWLTGFRPRGHTEAVTAIAFSPRPGSPYQLLSSSDDGTCLIWDARGVQLAPRI